MLNLLQKCIQNGVKWLDKNEPNWYNRINLDEFELTHQCRCVIGHISRAIDTKNSKNYYDYLTINDLNTKSMGFDSPYDYSNDPKSDFQKSWAIMENLWIEIIKERQCSIAAEAAWDECKNDSINEAKMEKEELKLCKA